jgi:predicted metalloprotease with PDZ domain
MAVFTDGGRSTDRTNWSTTVVSYYSHGGAIALALDLALRERSGGRVTLDDFMRAMWRVHGKPGGSRPGYVDRPYTMTEAERQLAEISGDERFARDFFARYIQGREVADYGRLAMQAGLVLRKQNPGSAWIGDVRFDTQSGTLRVASAPGIGSPAYVAGIDIGDEIRQISGTRVATTQEVNAALAQRRPGELVTVTFVDRSGSSQTRTVTLGEDPAVALMTVEASGGTLTDAQRAFRRSWLGQ